MKKLFFRTPLHVFYFYKAVRNSIVEDLVGTHQLRLKFVRNSYLHDDQMAFIFELCVIVCGQGRLLTQGSYLFQGQDLYKSKAVRDKQIVRVLGKVSEIDIHLLDLYIDFPSIHTLGIFP